MVKEGPGSRACGLTVHLPAQVSIGRYPRERVQPAENPRQLGKPLRGEKKGLWRYRVGDYRIICDVRDTDKVVVVLALGRHKQIYR